MRCSTIIVPKSSSPSTPAAACHCHLRYTPFFPRVFPIQICPVYNQENIPQNTQILILLGQFGLKATVTKHVVFSGPPAPIDVIFEHRIGDFPYNWHSQTTHSQSDPCSSSPDSRKTQPRDFPSTYFQSLPWTENRGNPSGGTLVVPVFFRWQGHG